MAWDRSKEMLRAYQHHEFSQSTQIDTLYNGLTEQGQVSLNAAAGGNPLNKTTREALEIIENKSKVHYLRSKSNVSRINTNFRDNVNKTDDRIDKLADQILNLVDIVNKQVIAPAKAVEKTCVTGGGAHAYYDCIAIDSNQPSVCVEIGSFNQINVLRSGFNIHEENLRRNLNNDMRSILGIFFQNWPSTLGTLPSNIVPNPKGEMKVVTTRGCLAYEGPSIPTNSPLEKVDEQNTEEIMEKSILTVQEVPLKSNLQFFADALLLMPKCALTIKSLLANKDKLFELEKVSLNEKCLAMNLKKLPEKLGGPADPRVHLILGRSFLRTGHALIDLYGEEITLRVNDESITFNFNQTMRYSLTYDDNFVNRVDVIDIACEEFMQDVLDFQYNPKSSNPTLCFQRQPFSVPNNQIQPGVSNEFSSYMKSNEIMIKSMQNQINVLRSGFNIHKENLRRNLNNDMRSILGIFFQNRPSTLGTLPSNIVPNPKGEMKVVTTRGCLAYEGPSIPTNSPLEKVDEQNTEEIMDKEHPNCLRSTAQANLQLCLFKFPNPMF
nr:reverse transcriptase domain-containing protein [Tanacetum cinerariifolium]